MTLRLFRRFLHVTGSTRHIVDIMRIESHSSQDEAGDSKVICWSCQQSLQPCDRMKIDSETEIPVCISCWQSMSVTDRLKHAQAFRDRADGGWVDELKTLLASSYGHFIDQRGGDEWMRGGGN